MMRYVLSIFFAVLFSGCFSAESISDYDTSEIAIEVNGKFREDSNVIEAIFTEAKVGGRTRISLDEEAELFLIDTEGDERKFSEKGRGVYTIDVDIPELGSDEYLLIYRRGDEEIEGSIIVWHLPQITNPTSNEYIFVDNNVRLQWSNTFQSEGGETRVAIEGDCIRDLESYISSQSVSFTFQDESLRFQFGADEQPCLTKAFVSFESPSQFGTGFAESSVLSVSRAVREFYLTAL
jgi:hypothetical protein